MQVNLIYCPITRPRVPIGIATLKAYIEANSNVSVKCFDANADFYAIIIRAIRDGMIDLGKATKGVLEAIDFFQSGDIPEFYERDIYHRHIAAWAAFTSRAVPHLGAKCFIEVLTKQVSQILSNDPDIVGFSCMFDSQIPHALFMAKIVKGMSPETQTILGGSSATANLAEHPEVDKVICGEGESELLAIVAGKTGPYDLDDMPAPDYSGFDLGSYFTPKPFVPIMGSRGCSWRRCAFCAHYNSYGKRFREASAEKVVDEMEDHTKRGVRMFGFVDEMVSGKRLMKLAVEIQRRGLDIAYYLMAKPTTGYNREALREAAKSGCQYIMWGMESGCQRTLDLMDKGISVQGVEDTLRAAGAAGIKNHVFIIAGFPSETEGEFRQTIRFLYRNRDNIYMVHKSIFGLQKDTPICRNPAKYHITEIHDRPGSLGYIVSRGVKQHKVGDVLKHYYIHFIGHLCRISPATGMMRDHALMQYSNKMVLPHREVPKVEDVEYYQKQTGDRI